VTPPLWPSPPPETRWLLRLPNWIGDAVMALPALRSLPVDPAHCLGVAHPRVIPLYRAAGLCGELRAARGARAPVDLRALMRRFAPHRAVVFTEAFSGPLLARLSGAPLRLGRGGGAARALYTHRLSPGDRSLRLWRQYLEVARAAGGSPSPHPDFRLDPGTSAARGADDLLAPLEGRAPVALAPGAAYGPAKRWPVDRFEALTRLLIDAGWPVIVTGGETERALGGRLARVGAHDFTGRTGLLEAVALLARARVLVTNDSGALHLGRAAGTPVVALFGSTSPRWTGPEPEEGVILTRDLSCSPCFRRDCPLSGDDRLRCLRDIGVEEVMRALQPRLTASADPPALRGEEKT